MKVYLLSLLLVVVNYSDLFAQDIAMSNSEQKVINVSDKKELEHFNKLNLDEVYPNLLDPRNVSDEEAKAVYKSWGEFHQKVMAFMKEQDFDWDVQDSTIALVNKIYFNKNGTVDYYAFNVLNPSVSDAKKEEFKKVITAFSANVKLELDRDSKFAQCGKTRYINY
ncbi:MAG: hypothetical protein ACNS60_06345 [Candidatus Cyclobacteriaceae bacterium M2_1C_046]